jgi:hypothetical protein
VQTRTLCVFKPDSPKALLLGWYVRVVVPSQPHLGHSRNYCPNVAAISPQPCFFLIS